uniref:Uncharacterized protein n=1 Tax=Acrobeloides nanus TaxID=290746 RepID=A0A914DHA6_9BILA
MMMIVWNIIKYFKVLNVNLEQILTDIGKNPALIKDLLPFMLAQLPLENQTALSWDYDDLFVWAAYERTELNILKDIVTWYQTTMGNCFTFNHDNSSRKYDLRYSGFKTLMRVRQDEYLSWVDTASLLVFVHPRGETIMSESVRYQAGPGEETSLFVSKVYMR